MSPGLGRPRREARTDERAVGHSGVEHGAQGRARPLVLALRERDPLEPARHDDPGPGGREGVDGVARVGEQRLDGGAGARVARVGGGDAARELEHERVHGVLAQPVRPERPVGVVGDERVDVERHDPGGKAPEADDAGRAGAVRRREARPEVTGQGRVPDDVRRHGDLQPGGGERALARRRRRSRVEDESVQAARSGDLLDLARRAADGRGVGEVEADGLDAGARHVPADRVGSADAAVDVARRQDDPGARGGEPLGREVAQAAGAARDDEGRAAAVRGSGGHRPIVSAGRC